MSHHPPLLGPDRCRGADRGATAGPGVSAALRGLALDVAHALAPARRGSSMTGSALIAPIGPGLDQGGFLLAHAARITEVAAAASRRNRWVRPAPSTPTTTVTVSYLRCLPG